MKPDLFEAPDYYNLDELLTDEHKLIRDSAREWVKKSVSPIIEEYAQKAEFPKHLIKGLGEIGAFGPSLRHSAPTGGGDICDECVSGPFVHKRERVRHNVSLAHDAKVHDGVFKGERWPSDFLRSRGARSRRHHNHFCAEFPFRAFAGHQHSAHPCATDCQRGLDSEHHSINPRPTFLMSPDSLSLANNWSKMPLMNPWLLGVL